MEEKRKKKKKKKLEKERRNKKEKKKIEYEDQLRNAVLFQHVIGSNLVPLSFDTSILQQ